MSVIDEVKQRLDIVEVIGEHTSLTKAGKTFRALCPFHSEKHPSFYVYPERQSWHCFGACATGGDVFSFIMKKENIDFGEALRLLAQRAGVTIPSRVEEQAGKDERERLYQINAAATQYYHNLLLNSPKAEKARNYLAGRGASAKSITDFQLGFSPNSWEALKQYLTEKDYTEAELLTAGLIIEAESGKKHDRFRNKLIFPICDRQGRITGFGARVLDDSLPKYINSPQTPVFDKSGSLYGINLATAAIRQQDQAVIVEGYMDVITAHQNGFSNVIASMGIAITEKQINAIQKLTKNITLVLDADTAGKEAMLRGIDGPLSTDVDAIIEYAGESPDSDIKVAVLPQGKDPDDIIKENLDIWVKITTEASPVLDYIFDMVASQLDLTTAKGKSLAVERLLPRVKQMNNVILQTKYVQKLTDMVGISDLILREVWQKIKPRKSQKPASTLEAVTQTLKPLFSSPIEEDCLTLLLQNPELKDFEPALSPEYFENTENREIFIAWQRADDLSSLKEKLDPAMGEYLDALAGKRLPPMPVERRYPEYIRRLRERYLKNLEAKRAQKFQVEAESGGPGADLAKLEEEGIEPSVQLREIYSQKGRAHSRQREVTR